MSKYRVHVECAKTLPEKSSQYVQCLSYVVGAPTEGIARAKAEGMARQQNVENDSLTPYATERLR